MDGRSSHSTITAPAQKSRDAKAQAEKGKAKAKPSDLEVQTGVQGHIDDSSIPVLSPTSAAQELLDHESEDPDDHTLETNDNDHWGDEDQDLQLRRQHEIGTARAIDLHHITPRPLPPLPLPQLPPYPSSQSHFSVPLLPNRKQLQTHKRFHAQILQRSSLAPPLEYKMPGPNVPKPGPAKLKPNSELAEWLEEAKQCHYLPEAVMKQLCEKVKECLMEGRLASGSNCQSLLIFLYRVEHPTCRDTCYDLR